PARRRAPDAAPPGRGRGRTRRRDDGALAAGPLEEPPARGPAAEEEWVSEAAPLRELPPQVRAGRADSSPPLSSSRLLPSSWSVSRLETQRWPDETSSPPIAVNGPRRRSSRSR